MKQIKGGRKVPGGFYLNRDNWELTVVQGTRGTLPVGKWTRVPILVMLLMTPVMGGLFVVFLPLIGFAMLLSRKIYLWNGDSQDSNKVPVSGSPGDRAVPAVPLGGAVLRQHS